MEERFASDRSGAVMRRSPFVSDAYIENFGSNDLCRSSTNILILDGNNDTSSVDDSSGDNRLQQSPPLPLALPLAPVADAGTDDVDGGHGAVLNEENVNHNANNNIPQEDYVIADRSETLDEDLIAKGLDNMARSADGTAIAYLHLTLNGYGLRDITMLSNYIHVQKADLTHNLLTDISPLCGMQNLLHLDVSHNALSKLLDFEAPINLKTADFSYNKITHMSDLSAHHYLQTLIIDYNSIEDIEGLSKCRRLSNLSIAHNRIQKIQNIEDLPIKHLNLSHNLLRKIECLETLKFLKTVNFAGNHIRSMDGLQNHDFLETIAISYNEIIDLSEVETIKELPLLRDLDMSHNPLGEMPDYRLNVLFHVQKLNCLDGKRTDVEEKAAAQNMFNPPIELLAARDHTMNIVSAAVHPSRVHDSTLPSMETPYPILVLVGPQGAGKKDLALKLVEEFPDYFGYAVSHTTRAQQPDEIDGKDYQFVTVDKFEDGIEQGHFLQTFSHGGQLYGLTIGAVEAVAREGLACVVHLELEGVLTFKNTFFEPRYVLIMPLSNEEHEQRLRHRNLYTEEQIQWTLNRVELYGSYNREHPGFFDMMINSDSISESYRKLCHLVTDYLGISVATPSVSDVEASHGELGLNSELTQDTIVSAGVTVQLARAWSRPSAAGRDRSAQLMVAGSSAPARSTGRGAVEEASIRRRLSIAKETVCGANPTIYDQITSRSAKTVPQLVSEQQNLGDDDLRERSVSAPTQMDALPPNSPDSSEMTNKSESCLSNISEACDLEGVQSVHGSQTNVVSGRMEDDQCDRVTVFTGSLTKVHRKLLSPDQSIHLPYLNEMTSIQVEPYMVDVNASYSKLTGVTRRLSQEERSVSSSSESIHSMSQPSSGRPGSERHPVLPPIAQAS